MSVAGDSLTAILLQSGKVFVAPGLLRQAVVPATPAELYDPVSNSWSVIGGLTRPLGSATLLSSGKVLVISGRSDVAQLYDPATGASRPTARLIITRDWHTATLLLSGKVLVVGGHTGDLIASAEIYDPARDVWSLTSPIATPHIDGADAALLPFGKVLVAGGGSGSYPGPQMVDSVDLYDPATASWTVSEVMTAARTFFTATPLPSGAVLFAGGLGAGGGLSSAEIYTSTCLPR
jgi:hypothetical protein